MPNLTGPQIIAIITAVAAAAIAIVQALTGVPL